MTDDKNTLKYKDLSLHIAADVWHELERVKLHDWKLEEPDAPVRLFIPNAPIVGGASSKKLSMASFVPEGLRNAEATLENHHYIPGILKNFNTVNQLTDLDATQRQALLTAAAQKLLLNDLVDRNSPWWTKPATTTSADKGDPFYFSPVVSVVFTFADLKTHEFHYCAAFPTIDLRSNKSPVTVASRLTTSAGIAKAIGGDNTTTAVLGHVKSVRLNLRAPAGAPFVIDTKNGAILPFHSSTVTPADLVSGQHVVAFLDSVGSGEYPGWAARNIITAIRLTHPAITEFQLLALRGPLVDDLGDDSIMFSCTCSPLAESVLSRLAPNSEDPLPSIGWVEKSITKINMGGVMDSVQLATSSAKLNLSLMKWRMLPELQLEPLQGCKALLLGSGTLGCNIGRHLLMWGVTHLTFVDRGNVSYSNPVRQTLFELSDVLAEGEKRCKSIAAANAIKRILPSANATGVNLTIRMPGHRVDAGGEESAKKDIETLENLIKSHDVVFLLTDSRESRWLPTVLASLHNVPVINSALGFDTYVVMRHGVAPTSSTSAAAAAEARLGCYFCNDVVAPQDSLTARSLDQQCTVTRPGVSAMASALSVEMLAAIYNHSDRFAAPPHREDMEDAEESASAAAQRITPLGVIPHQLRGNVYTYGLNTLYGRQYDKCTACSEAILKHVRGKEGYDFLIKCLNDPQLMEEVTGLKAEKDAVAAKYADWDDDAAFDD